MGKVVLIKRYLFIYLRLCLSLFVLFAGEVNAQLQNVLLSRPPAVNVDEGGNITFTLLIQGFGIFSVPVEISGTGITAGDFGDLEFDSAQYNDLNPLPTNVTLDNTTIPTITVNGFGILNLAIATTDDTLLEGDKTATFSIGTVSFDVTIKDNEYRFCFEQDSYEVGEDVGSLSLPLKLFGPDGEARPLSEDITVDFLYQDVSTAKTDYVVNTTSTTIAAGTTKHVVNLQINDDTVPEATELLRIITQPPQLPDGYSDCSTEITIADNDLTVDIAADSATITEGNPASFTVTSNGPIPASLPISLNVAATGDFVVATEKGMQSLTIPANQTNATLGIPTVDDTMREADGTITVTLIDSSAYKKGTSDSASIAIEDNDPTVDIIAGDAISEGSPALFTVIRNAPAPTPLTLNLNVAEATGNTVGDFVATTDEGRKSLTIGANRTTATLSVSTNDDSMAEHKGSITITLTDPTIARAYYKGTPDSATLTVYDNDCLYALDVDQDDDGLIEICDLNALDAIRQGLDGSAYNGSTMGCADGPGGSGQCVGYELVRDLDFTMDASYNNPPNPMNKSRWTSGDGWQAIGSASSPFTAIFEGNRHTISKLSINPSSAVDNAALFAKLSRLGKIANLELSGVNIGKGGSGVGSLVGINEGIISGVNVTGDSLVGERNDVGGLVGVNEGSIFRGVVVLNSLDGVNNVGGLVGRNTEQAQIVDSFAVTELSGMNQVGGLVGLNVGGKLERNEAGGIIAGSMDIGGLVGRSQGGQIINSWATGSVRGTADNAGGLVGRTNQVQITQSYALNPSVEGANNVGGLIGSNDGAVLDSYAASGVTASGNNPNIGGLVGFNGTNAAITHSYWDTEVADIDDDRDDSTGIGKSTNEMKSSLPSDDIYTDWQTSVWEFASGEYPNLKAPTVMPLPYLLRNLMMSGDLRLFPPFDPFIFNYNLLVKPDTRIQLNADRAMGAAVSIQCSGSTCASSLPGTISLNGKNTTEIVISIGSGARQSQYRFSLNYIEVNISRSGRNVEQISVNEGDTINLEASYSVAPALPGVSYSYNWFESGSSLLDLSGVDTTTSTLSFDVPKAVVPKDETTKTLVLKAGLGISSEVFTTGEVSLTVQKVNNDDGSGYQLTAIRDDAANHPNTYRLVFSDVDEDGGFAEGFIFPLIQWQRRLSGGSWENIGDASYDDVYTIPYSMSPYQYRAQGTYEDRQGYEQVVYSVSPITYIGSITPSISYTLNGGSPTALDEAQRINVQERDTVAFEASGSSGTYRWYQVSGKRILPETTVASMLEFQIPEDFVERSEETSEFILILEIRESATMMVSREIPLTITKVNNGTVSGSTKWISDTALSAPDINDVDGNPLSRSDITYRWRTKANGTYTDIADTNSKTYQPPSGFANTTIYQVGISYTDGQGYTKTVQFGDASPFSDISGRVDRDGNGLIEVWYLEDLNAIRNNPTGQGSGQGCPTDGGCFGYELTRDLDFNNDESYSNTSTNKSRWTTGQGWEGIADFEATFEGNGHTISNLMQSRSDVGLFENVPPDSLRVEIRRLGLLNISIESNRAVSIGGLVSRFLSGKISDSYVTGEITDTSAAQSLVNDGIGGLVGEMRAGSNREINRCYSEVNIRARGITKVGGLVGSSTHSIIDSYATGNVSKEGSSGVPSQTSSVGFGGLVGQALGNITNSYATGTVNYNGTLNAAEGANNVGVGGLAGLAGGNIESSYASATVNALTDVGGGNATTFGVGGLIGRQSGGGINNSYASGDVTARMSNNVGGLVGWQQGDIQNSFAIGNVIGRDQTGGLVGRQLDGGNMATEIVNSFAIGNVIGRDQAGGLVGAMWGGANVTKMIINNGYAQGDVSGSDYVAGLVGRIYKHENTFKGQISDSYAISNVRGMRGNTTINGLAGGDGGKINRSYWAIDRSGSVSGNTSDDSANYKGFSSENLRLPTAQGTANGDAYYLWLDDNWDFGTDKEYPALKYNDDTCAGTEPSVNCGKLLLYQRIGLRDLILRQGGGTIGVIPDFNTSTSNYVVAVRSDVKTLDVIPIPANPDAQIIVTVDGKIVSPNVLGYPAMLNPSTSTIITIQAVGQNSAISEEPAIYRLTVNHLPEIKRVAVPTAIDEGDNATISIGISDVDSDNLSYRWIASADDPTSAKLLSRIDVSMLTGEITSGSGNLGLSFAVPEDLLEANENSKYVSIILTLSGGGISATEEIGFTVRKKNNATIVPGAPTRQAFTYEAPSIDLSADPDGTGDASDIRYQWQRRLTGVWSDIDGATNQSYTLDGVVGDRYRVLVSYIDGQGYSRRVPSESVAAAADVIYEITDDADEVEELTLLYLLAEGLTPNFSRTVNDYRVPGNIAFITVAAGSAAGEINVNGSPLEGFSTNVSLGLGSNTILIEWQSGERSQTYQAVVVRQSQAGVIEPALSNGTIKQISAGNYTGSVIAGTTNTQVFLNREGGSGDVVVNRVYTTLNGQETNYIKDGSAITIAQSNILSRTLISETIPLSEDENTVIRITLSVPTEGGSMEVGYTITIPLAGVRVRVKVFLEGPLQ